MILKLHPLHRFPDFADSIMLRDAVQREYFHALVKAYATEIFSEWLYLAVRIQDVALGMRRVWSAQPTEATAEPEAARPLTMVRGNALDYLARLDYDKFGQRVYMELGNGVKTTYAYAPDTRRLSNLNSMLPQASKYVFQNLNYRYDAVGNITQLVNDVQLPSSVERHGDFGDRGRHDDGGDRGQNKDRRDKDDGDDIGHLVGGPSTQNFTYDDLYRLTGATGTYKNRERKTNRYTLSMVYDGIHNITQKRQLNEIVESDRDGDRDRNGSILHGTTYNYDYAYKGVKPHAASAVGRSKLRYDANGNLIQRSARESEHGWDWNSGNKDGDDDSRQLVWDEENRLACVREHREHILPQTPESCERGGGEDLTRFVYNASGIRVVKRGRTLQFSINENFTQREDVGFRHVFVGMQRLVTKRAERWDDRRDAPLWYYHTDNLSSSSYLTNREGELTEYLNYFPSGETWIQERDSLPIQFMFTGQQLDPETGYYAFPHRYYNPRFGTWISPDMAIEQYLPNQSSSWDLPGMGGIYNSLNINLYQYANFSPVKYIDPDGRVAILIPAAVGFGVGASASIVQQYLTNPDHKINWWTVIASGAGGAISGGLGVAFGAAIASSSAGIAMGAQASAGMGAAFAGSIGSGVSQVGGNLAEGKPPAENVPSSMIIGGLVAAPLGYFMAPSVSRDMTGLIQGVGGTGNTIQTIVGDTSGKAAAKGAIMSEAISRPIAARVQSQGQSAGSQKMGRQGVGSRSSPITLRFGLGVAPYANEKQ